MANLVDKDALVAEIEIQIELLKPFLGACAAQIVAEANDKLSVLEGLKNFLDTLEVEELPIWEKVSPDTGQTTLYKDGAKSYLERFGYRIDLKDLDKLPKKNSTHRTPADIEAAMQEVEEKSEAYTNAHRGERDDDVLSQMRGEPVSEELEVSSKEWLRPQLDKSYANYGEAKMMELTHFDGYAMLEAIEFGAKWREEHPKEKPTSEDLEEAAINYMKSQNPPIWGLHDGFIAGADWKEEKVMAKAVETTFNVSLPSGLYDKLWIKGCKKGDKLLIIKED